MAYNLEEQEQLATLRAWWNRFGNLVTWLLIAVLAAYAGWTGWKSYQRNQANQAAALYQELQKSAESKDLAKTQRAAGDLQSKFPSTNYAPMAALMAAKVAHDANDLAAAKKHLQWAAEQANEAEYSAIAKIRLAGIYLDEKAYDDALRSLSAEFPAQFAGVVADRRGDILMAQRKPADAVAAYRLALEKMDAKNPGRQLVQIKLDSISGASAKSPA